MDTEPLDADALRLALRGVVGELDVVARTGSTNADLLARARTSAGPPSAPAPDRPVPDRAVPDRAVPDRTVLVAEAQDAGRGRLDRRWESPPGAGLTFSVLLRPVGVPPARLGWLPLLAGLSLVRTVRELTGLAAVLKWPNDLLVGPREAKCAGLLAEVAGPDAVVLGIGLNVRTRPDQLPAGVDATSLLAEGADVSRHDVLVALLRRLLADEAAWRAHGGDPGAVGLPDAYRAVCATVGAEVRIDAPGGRSTHATAVDVDGEGRLVVRGPGGDTRAVAAGDVVHVRAIP
ncbi:MAG TPA: biotin--[acetyl-CoA-carboxylase] ligase [Pseudonocardia sp.]